jgi:hypothetical protein
LAQLPSKKSDRTQEAIVADFMGAGMVRIVTEESGCVPKRAIVAFGGARLDMSPKRQCFYAYAANDRAALARGWCAR